MSQDPFSPSLAPTILAWFLFFDVHPSYSSSSPHNSTTATPPPSSKLPPELAAMASAVESPDTASAPLFRYVRSSSKSSSYPSQHANRSRDKEIHFSLHISVICFSGQCTYYRITNTFTSAAALGEIVIVEVGPKKQQYKVHKDLICHSSEYFRVAFNGPWKETEDRKVLLLDVEPEICMCYLTWFDGCTKLTCTFSRCLRELALHSKSPGNEKRMGWSEQDPTQYSPQKKMA